VPVEFGRYPALAAIRSVRDWLGILEKVQRADATLSAYAASLEDFVRFAERRDIDVLTASRQEVAEYVADLTQRPQPRSRRRPIGLSNATIQQRLTALRLFFEYLIEEGLRETNPVGRGGYRPGASRVRIGGLVRRSEVMPWLPSDDEWSRLIAVAADDPLRNRVMFALAYDCGLRREELCCLEIHDFDFAYRLVTVRSETTKTRRRRVVPYSQETARLLQPFLSDRRRRRLATGPLFLSLSPRNANEPIGVHTWTKAVESLAKRARVDRFTTHTFRHSCLTDLARAGWTIADIAAFAGHRSTD
jgi:integrase/recombinase XerD